MHLLMVQVQIQAETVDSVLTVTETQGDTSWRGLELMQNEWNTIQCHTITLNVRGAESPALL